MVHDLSLFGDKNKQNKSIKDIVYNTYKPFVILLNNNNDNLSFENWKKHMRYYGKL